jgi:hypothetical protein
MTRRRLRWIKRLSAAIVAGWVFDLSPAFRTERIRVGTGLSQTEATGVHGPIGPTANAIGAGLDLFADIARFGPKIH